MQESLEHTRLETCSHVANICSPHHFTPGAHLGGEIHQPGHHSSIHHSRLCLLSGHSMQHVVALVIHSCHVCAPSQQRLKASKVVFLGGLQGWWGLVGMVVAGCGGVGGGVGAISEHRRSETGNLMFRKGC